jgi:hypothetical protein
LGQSLAVTSCGWFFDSRAGRDRRCGGRPSGGARLVCRPWAAGQRHAVDVDAGLDVRHELDDAGHELDRDDERNLERFHDQHATTHDARDLDDHPRAFAAADHGHDYDDGADDGSVS